MWCLELFPRFYLKKRVRTTLKLYCSVNLILMSTIAKFEEHTRSCSKGNSIFYCVCQKGKKRSFQEIDSLKCFSCDSTINKQKRLRTTLKVHCSVNPLSLSTIAKFEEHTRSSFRGTVFSIVLVKKKGGNIHFKKLVAWNVIQTLFMCFFLNTKSAYNPETSL